MSGHYLIEWLRGQGYTEVRELPDGTIVGTQNLLFTRALFIGMDRWGWERRYCYEDRALADEACKALKTGEDEPLPGYVARRAR